MNRNLLFLIAAFPVLFACGPQVDMQAIKARATELKAAEKGIAIAAPVVLATSDAFVDVSVSFSNRSPSVLCLQSVSGRQHITQGGETFKAGTRDTAAIKPVEIPPGETRSLAIRIELYDAYTIADGQILNPSYSPRYSDLEKTGGLADSGYDYIYGQKIQVSVGADFMICDLPGRVLTSESPLSKPFRPKLSK